MLGRVVCLPNVCDLDVRKVFLRLVNRLVDLLIILDPCTEIFGSLFGVLTIWEY